MTVTIAAVSDTHCRTWDEVHPDIRRALVDADIAVHCGDFSRMDVVEGIRREAKRAVVVHGNSDPVDIRRAIPYVEELEVEDDPAQFPGGIPGGIFDEFRGPGAGPGRGARRGRPGRGRSQDDTDILGGARPGR